MTKRRIRSPNGHGRCGGGPAGGHAMPIPRFVAGAICIAAAMVLLLAPALWNGFPLLQWDTGGYLARWYEGYLVPSRSTVYGLFVFAGWPLDFWPVVAVQSALTLWIVALVLRLQGFGGNFAALLAVVTALCLFTTLPFLTSILLTDIFAGLSVLALHMLLLQGEELAPVERAALVVLVAFSAATHSATFAVLLGVLAAALAYSAVCRTRPFAPGLMRGAVALMLGAIMLLSANFALSGRVAWTPGGYGILFGRMLEDGIVARYLRERCPDARFRLCAHQHELPRNADEFLWGQGLFDRLGRFAGLNDEMRIIVLESLAAYPALQLKKAAIDAATQLVRVESGEGVLDSIWHTYAIIKRYTPSAVPALDAARQQRGEIGFQAINRLHVPVALCAMALLAAVVLLGWRRRRFAGPGLLAATVTIALLANAVICGALANPHSRYGARLAWLAPLVLLLVAMRHFRTKEN